VLPGRSWHRVGRGATMVSCEVFSYAIIEVDGETMWNAMRVAMAI
jgi:hypothetical protein